MYEEPLPLCSATAAERGGGGGVKWGRNSRGIIPGTSGTGSPYIFQSPFATTTFTYTTTRHCHHYHVGPLFLIYFLSTGRKSPKPPTPPLYRNFSLSLSLVFALTLVGIFFVPSSPSAPRSFYKTCTHTHTHTHIHTHARARAH